MGRISTDPYIKQVGRDVWEEEFKGQIYRIPALLAGRYKPERILAKGGYGLLLVARDSNVFDRRVLIKKGLWPNSIFSCQHNVAVARAHKENADRANLERAFLLHGQLRNVYGIPVLIDWFRDLDPMMYGPHTDDDGQTFVLDDARLYSTVDYLVLNYFDGVPLEEFCTTRNFTGNLQGSVRYLGIYIASILHEFHQTKQFGKNNLHFIYQDLKPDNILCSRRGGVFQLIDFGSFAGVFPGKTVNQGIRTEPYAAPETQGPQGRISPSSDIYSLGMLLKVVIQKACGKQPRVDEDFAPQRWRINAALRDFLIKATAQKPEDRFAQMREVVISLSKIPPQGEVCHV